jgi:cytochrome P450
MPIGHNALWITEGDEMPRTPWGMPASSVDLFADSVLLDPYPVYASLRELGPAVRLTSHDVWAVPRYADIQQVLTDPDTWSSVNGVAMTADVNTTLLNKSVLASDGAEHARRRNPLSRQLNSRAVRGLTEWITDRADALVDAHLRKEDVFDAVQLAQEFVADVIMTLMGLPPDTRDLLIANGHATLDVFGPANRRHKQSAPIAAAMVDYLHREVSRDTVLPGTWLHALYAAADAGKLPEDEVVPVMTAYTAASMDTTIHGLANTIRLLATHPEQWALLRDGLADPVDAFHEALRLDAPAQALGRRATRSIDIGDVRIGAGQQVWLLYGSAGRDSRQWGNDVNTFSIGRPGGREHLSFGAGPHGCPGFRLAECEAGALLGALLTRCDRLQLAGEPSRLLNNLLRGWQHVPLTAERRTAF